MATNPSPMDRKCLPSASLPQSLEQGKEVEQEQEIAIFNGSKVLRQTRVKPANLVGSNRERPLGGPGPSISNVCRFRLRFVFAVAIRKNHVSSKKIWVPGRLSSRKSSA